MRIRLHMKGDQTIQTKRHRYDDRRLPSTRRRRRILETVGLDSQKRRNRSFQLLVLCLFTYLLQPFVSATSQIGTISSDGTVVGSQGGTELIRNNLMRRLPKTLTSRFRWSFSRVRTESNDDETESKTRKKLLLLHDLPEDPESRHLAKKGTAETFDALIFVSEHQRTRYRQRYDLSNARTLVIRNAIAPFTRRRSRRRRDEPVRLIYHTTPHRGLELLIPIFIELDKQYQRQPDGPNVVLDVYSSFGIYGWADRDEPYRPLFDICARHPRCFYHGHRSNDFVRKQLRRNAHIFAYPSIWEETSCIAVIEALAAGCDVVTSSLGALPETIGTVDPALTYVYPFDVNRTEHANRFAETLDRAIRQYDAPRHRLRRREQQIAATAAYAWGTVGFDGRIDEWTSRLLDLLEPGDLRFRDGDDEGERQMLLARGFADRGRRDAARTLYAAAIRTATEPWSTAARVALGQLDLAEGNAEDAVARFADAVDVLPKDESAYYGLAVRVAFHRASRYEYDEARRWFERAARSRHPRNDCWQVFRTTLVPHLPRTAVEGTRTIERYRRNMARLVRRAAHTAKAKGFANDSPIRELVANAIGKDDDDAKRTGLLVDGPRCFASAFPIAYYDLDFREELELWVSLQYLAMPKRLAWIAPDLIRTTAKTSPLTKSLRVGVVSSFFSSQSSIWGSFGWTIRQLQSHPLLDVELVYYPRTPISEFDRELSLRPETNLYLERLDALDGGASLARARRSIAARRYDVLIYLDLFMTQEMHQLAMARLAPVQATTHGHPVTSGIPRDVMDYYLSWSAAERADAATTRYTETLALIRPANDGPWEYWLPRTSPERTSLVVGGASFSELSLDRARLAAALPADDGAKRLVADSGTRLYFCAQAAFKYHPTFDVVLSDILRADPNATLLLVESIGQLERLHPRFVERMRRAAGSNVDRIAYVRRMPHHVLMATYALADVVLDSAYFGGDTTTREALEVGAPIVTLPHRALGQRWTAAYLSILGDEFAEDLIAHDPKDYVARAVRVASSSTAEKEKRRERIRAAANATLFRSDAAAPAWAATIVNIATEGARWRWRRTRDGRDGARGDRTEL